ncbi:MAG: hypothetical protein R6U68_17485, partial [Desulfobacteraceae bacterium]
MAVKDKNIKKLVDPQECSACESTQQMHEKARRDGVMLHFDRAADMKACPIGSDSACCKNCFMGPCRLNAKDPYKKVGVCGATIDTIMARNFARAVASGASAHTDHGMAMLELFRDVVNGKVLDYTIKDEEKLINVASSLGIETDDMSIKDIANALGKLQALRRVQGHHLHRVLVGIGGPLAGLERGMGQEFGEPAGALLRIRGQFLL